MGLWPVDAVIQSLAAFEHEYREEVLHKSLWRVEQINSLIQGAEAPVGEKELEMWSWLHQVQDGPQKTEAKDLIAKTYTDRETLTGGLKANFLAEITSEIAKHEKLKEKYDVYKQLQGPADEVTGSMLDLRNQYHSMTADLKAVNAALEQLLTDAWETSWRGLPFSNKWKSTAQTYKARFDVIAAIMDPGRAVNGDGNTPDAAYQDQWNFFKALVDNGDTKMVNHFTHKMAGELKHFL